MATGIIKQKIVLTMWRNPDAFSRGTKIKLRTTSSDGNDDTRPKGSNSAATIYDKKVRADWSRQPVE